MRKKNSDRSKPKGTPEKSPEKSSRRSHRHSRRKRKSSSSSSSDDEKPLKKGTKDIKTETKNVEEKVVSAKTTETVKIDVENDVTAESSKKNTKKNTENTNSPLDTTNKEAVNEEWKEDKEFWNSSEGIKESETAETTAKEKDGGSMWKIQSANGAGGEIQKLKICRQRPADNSDSGDSSKRRSSRPSDGGASSRSTDESVTEECEKETKKSKHNTRSSSRNSPLLESSKVVCDVSDGSPTKIKIINVGNLAVEKKTVEKSENVVAYSQELCNNVLSSDIPLPSDTETKVLSEQEKEPENEISPSLDGIQAPLEKCNSTEDTNKPSEEINSELKEVNEKSFMAVDLSEIPEPPDEPKNQKKPETEEDNHEGSEHNPSQLETSERKEPDSDSRSRSSRSSSSSNESEGTNEEESPHRKAKVKIRRQHRKQSPSAQQRTDKKNASSDSEEDGKKEEDGEVTSQRIENNSCKENKSNRSPETAEGGNDGASEPYKVRKRRWGASKSIRPSKKPLVSISTNSLKDLVPGAKPVSAEELQLSVEEEEGQLVDDDDDDDVNIQEDDEITILSMSETKVEEKSKEKEREIEEKKRESRRERERSEEERKRKSEKKQKTKPEQPSVNEKGGNQRKILLLTDDARKLARSPSPPRRRPSHVLYITNLVRPFTVQQLKNLLLRTGTIAENGFWIDNIKSKCYVEYTTEDAAVETRHALHGVRWPVSNPKTLVVEFSTHDDMAVAQALAEETEPIPRKAEPLILDRSVEGWLNEQARLKGDRPARRVMASVREWDVGKPEHPDEIIEQDLHIKDRQREQERRVRKERLQRSPSEDNSEPPVRKLRRKEDDAPAKLLDDLFRKTKSSPCIYWLPLTQEQIVVKEEIRRQHMAEHERRVAELKKADQARRDRDRRNRK